MRRSHKKRRFSGNFHEMRRVLKKLMIIKVFSTAPFNRLLLINFSQNVARTMKEN